MSARVALVSGAARGIGRACAQALAEVSALGGEGGCIAVDRRGRLALPFAAPGMPRGVVHVGREPRVAVHRDETLEGCSLRC